MYTLITVEMAAPKIAESIQGKTISDLLAEREKDPRKAAALARARKKLSSVIASDGNSVASLRLAKGLSQQQLANNMGVKQPHIARIERGEDVKISTILSLANALNESPEVVFKALESQLKMKETA